MSTYPDANLTFGGAQFRLINPDDALYEPEPEAGDGGEWTHIPYGGNVYEEDEAPLFTRWSPAGGILIPAAADGSNPHYSTFNALRHKFANLQTPWGTRYARLAQLQVAKDTRGRYRGQATWEWA